MMSQSHSFAHWCPVMPVPFVEEVILFVLCVVDILGKGQLTIYVWIYIWASDNLYVCLYSIILFFLLQLCDIF